MQERIVTILKELVGINSINASLSGGPGEGEIAGFIRHFLGRLGLEAKLYSTGATCVSVAAVVRGQGGGEAIVLNGHIDTVGVEGMDAPFALRRDGDRLYGRGAYDMKGGVAVMLALAEHFAADPPPGDLWLTFSGDEEDHSLGTSSSWPSGRRKWHCCPVRVFPWSPPRAISGSGTRGSHGSR